MIAVLRLFLLGLRIQNPVVLEVVTLPCLRIMQHMIQPEHAAAKKAKDGGAASVRAATPALRVDARRFLRAETPASFVAWKKRMLVKGNSLSVGPVCCVLWDCF